MSYEYFNPNPKKRVRRDGTPMRWHKGDCTTRALSKALDCTWKEAFQKQCEKAMELCEETDDQPVYEAVLLDNGFKKGTILKEWINEIHRRPTVGEVIDCQYREFNKIGISGKRLKLVIGATHHLVAAENDTICDTWDCGDSVAWSFWWKIVSVSS